MTRNPANSANADDSWEQLEADLFGVEVGKEHTAAERVASEPALPASDLPIEAVPKPIEEDDFGDFGAGVVEAIEGGEPPPRRSSAPPRPRTKPTPKADPTPAKPLPVEPAPAFNLADLDEGPTDEELDEASDDQDSDEEGAPEAEGDDPYWDPLANWNWQEDEQSRKGAADSGLDRGRSRGGRGDRPERGGPRGRGGRSERRPHQAPESHAADEERGLSTPRRPYPERDRSRVDEAPVSEPAAEAPQVGSEATAPDDTEQSRPGGKSRRQDRRRSRRHTQAASIEPDEPALEQEPVDQSIEDAWPPVDEPDRPASVEATPSRVPRLDELDPDFEEESAEGEEEPSEGGESEDRGPRRRRGRRRRRRVERPASGQSETAADEDIKHLEDDVEEDEFSDSPAAEESGSEAEESESGRGGRTRRPRRRRRGGRSDRPERPAPAPRARQGFVEDDDLDEEDDEALALDADEEFDEDQDREFVEEDVPQSRRPGRSRRSTSETPFVRHIEDDDEEDSEPEPAVSYEDVPSWEEAISYLLNPSMVEGGNGGGGERAERGDRGDRPPRGERSSRPPRRGPRRDS